MRRRVTQALDVGHRGAWLQIFEFVRHSIERLLGPSRTSTFARNEQKLTPKNAKDTKNLQRASHNLYAFCVLLMTALPLVARTPSSLSPFLEFKIIFMNPAELFRQESGILGIGAGDFLFREGESVPFWHEWRDAAAVEEER